LSEIILLLHHALHLALHPALHLALHPALHCTALHCTALHCDRQVEILIMNAVMRVTLDYLYFLYVA